MMGYIIAALVVVASYMVWYLWKWLFYPVCSGAYLKLTSANPDKWCIIKCTYGDGKVRFKVGGANVDWVGYDKKGKATTHLKTPLRY